jgi:NADH:ubiquinone oxidoreductase subunit 4 (subunit M)
VLFDRSCIQYQFILSNIYNTKLNTVIYFDNNLINYTHQFIISFGLDGLSLFFILLSTFIIPLCLLTSYKQGLTKVKDYCLILITLELFLILSFSALDLIAFFFFFESILIPMFFLIGI